MQRVTIQTFLGCMHLFCLVVSTAAADELTTPLANLLCKYTPGLNEAQRNICRDYPSAMPVLQQEVTKLVQDECTSQMKDERWNCSTIVPPIVGEQADELQGATKEAAFTHALTSASMVYAITKACSEGRINNCGCDNSMNGKEIQSGWQWGGCSDDVEFGDTFTTNFLDAREREGNSQIEVGQSLANLHNNAVGRMVVKNGMKLKCRCHGVSGSCAMRTCWRELPNIENIGQQIKEKYDDSIQVSVKETKSKPTLRSLKEPAEGHDSAAVPTSLLVHLKQSSDYCAFKANYTKGRICVPKAIKNSFSAATNGTTIIVNTALAACEDLCCTGEFTEHSHTVIGTCDCIFKWCCEVQCSPCTTITNTYTCNS